jgi:hypothetical protein
MRGRGRGSKGRGDIGGGGGDGSGSGDGNSRPTAHNTGEININLTAAELDVTPDEAKGQYPSTFTDTHSQKSAPQYIY